METITINNDIPVFCIAAKSFPEGVLDAHKKLYALVPFSKDRKYFGISRPEKGSIVYKAAAEEIYAGEGQKLNCETLILKKGNYICLTINDYQKDIQSISKAFNKLIANPNLDPEGYCVEWYFTDKDVKCMIRLKQ